ncbi:MAG: hypothetical protein HWN68_10475 [Desulfobacterales bacterium]|nr:hypothetical protein [Desulfobacterales bacterium]
MKNIKKTTLAVLLIIFVFPAISEGETSALEINANSTDMELKFDTQLELYETPVGLGVGAINSDNDYFIFNVNVMIKDAVFMPALMLGLGFKGLLGQTKIDSKEFDIGALNFLITGEYDFRVDSSNLPVSASASLCWAPESLGFADTERYVEFTFSVYAYVVSNAAIVAGYREIEARFSDDPDNKTKSDSALFVGCKLVF